MNKQLQDLMDRQRDWSDKTFAKGKFTYERAIPISYHLQKEARELTDAVEKFISNPEFKSATNVREGVADVLLLLLDCAAHLGMSVDSMLLHAETKHMVNVNRKWGEPDANGVVEHIVDTNKKIDNSEIQNNNGRVPDVGKTIDWEQREWGASVAAMQAISTAIFSNKEAAAAMLKRAESENIDTIEFIVKMSIENAKELVKQFKVGHYDKRDSESNT